MSTRYLLLGVLVGLIAPAGLVAYVSLEERPVNLLQMFLATSLGSVVTLAIAGWMIGRRDDALEGRNRELRALTEKLAALSATDALTGLANRRTFDERLAVELARTRRYGTPLALVMMDLDHFKDMNDRFGHPAGDEVLRRVAATLEREKRLGDVVARYGGEEFAAVLPHTDAGAAQAWAERVRQLIASTQVSSDAGALSVTASFGVAEAAATLLDDPGGLVGEADRALYAAKRMGRNRVVTRHHRPRRSTRAV